MHHTGVRLAVSFLRRNGNGFCIARAHSRNGTIEARDNLATAEGKLQRVSPCRAVKLSAVIQSATVVYADGIA